MPTKEQVIESLEAVLVPAIKRSIVGMNLVREVTTFDKKVNVTLASTGLIPGAQDWIKAKAKEAVEKLPEINSVEVEYADAKAKDLNQVDHMIAVMSAARRFVAAMNRSSLRSQMAHLAGYCVMNALIEKWPLPLV